MGWAGGLGHAVSALRRAPTDPERNIEHDEAWQGRNPSPGLSRKSASCPAAGEVSIFTGNTTAQAYLTPHGASRAHLSIDGPIAGPFGVVSRARPLAPRAPALPMPRPPAPHRLRWRSRSRHGLLTSGVDSDPTGAAPAGEISDGAGPRGLLKAIDLALGFLLRDAITLL